MYSVNQANQPTPDSTLAIFSFLYADNPVYKLAEHLFVGISAGYGVVITWHEAVIPLLIVYPFVQKYFTKGVLLGSVKG